MLKLFSIALVVFLLDQGTKFWINQNIPYPTYPSQEAGAVIAPAMEVIEDFFYIVHIGNRGAAWGIFEGYGHLLGIFGVLAVGAIVYFRKALELDRPIPCYCFGAMIGGILGNVIDRLMHGHVIDFLDFWLPGYRWPSFNVADMAIVIGVAGYLIFSFREDVRKKKEEDEQTS